MPLPTAITDLSTTAASNYPAGSDSPATLDDVQRAHAAFIAQLRDGNGSAPEIDIASGATVNIGGAASPFLRVTGTTSITSFGTNYKGAKYLRFAGAVSLTYNATTLLLPGGVNYTTAAGDTFIAYPKSTSGTADGWVLVLCSKAIAQSMIRLNTANGYGSTNTKIRRFTNTVTSQGADITYADSATLGASFTTVNAGVYAVSFCDSGNAQTGVGISLNTTGPTTNIFALTISEVLAALSTTAADFGAEASWTGYLPAGSIIRAHTGGVPVGAIAQYTQFTITRIA